MLGTYIFACLAGIISERLNLQRAEGLLSIWKCHILLQTTAFVLQALWVFMLGSVSVLGTSPSLWVTPLSKSSSCCWRFWSCFHGNQGQITKEKVRGYFSLNYSKIFTLFSFFCCHFQRKESKYVLFLCIMWHPIYMSVHTHWYIMRCIFL